MEYYLASYRSLEMLSAVQARKARLQQEASGSASPTPSTSRPSSPPPADDAQDKKSRTNSKRKTSTGQQTTRKKSKLSRTTSPRSSKARDSRYFETLSKDDTPSNLIVISDNDDEDEGLEDASEDDS